MKALKVMVKFIAAFALLGLTIPAPAQETAPSPTPAATAAEDTPDTIIIHSPVSSKVIRLLQPDPNFKIHSLTENGITAHGGFGGPNIKITKIDGKTACLVGGNGAWIINHSFLIGGGGYGLSTPKIKRNFENQPKALDFGYGGLELGYIFASDQLLHVTFQALIAGGGVGYCDRIKIGQDRDGEDIFEDNGRYDSVFVLEPTVGLELNVTEWFRICLGGSYRYVTGLELETVADYDLSGPSAELALRFGFF